MAIPTPYDGFPIPCPACEGHGLKVTKSTFGQHIGPELCDICKGNKWLVCKAPTSPTSSPTDPDQANPPQDSQAHLKAILDVVRELESAIDELRQVVSQIAKQ